MNRANLLPGTKHVPRIVTDWPRGSGRNEADRAAGDVTVYVAEARGTFPALTTNRLLYRDGIPIALLAGGEVQFLEALDPSLEWKARKTLMRGAVPASLIDVS